MGKSRKAKNKKSKKARCEVGRATPPRFLYSNSEIVRRKDPVSINDVRDLVLHIIADSPPPSWIRVQNTQSIQKLIVLLIPGLTSTVLSLPPLPTSATENPNLPIPIPLLSDPPPPTPSKPPDLPSSVDSHSEEAAALYGGVPFIARTFSHACPTRAPGDTTRMHSVLNTFFQTPVSGEEKKRRLQERISAERTQKKSPAQYILTTEQMVENDYPVPSYLADVFTKSEGWIETPQATADAEGSQEVYAVDCEMCMTNDGKALTRVCVIDFDSGKVVYDRLVKPPSPITDYLTRYSGITAEALDPVITTLADVQTHLRTLINPSTILLGHSLESDLRALQLAHPHCIDTALLFHHPRGRPLKPGLAWLTRKWLGRTIQDRGPGGHNPEEDARACLDLLKAKIKNVTIFPAKGLGSGSSGQIMSRFWRASRVRTRAAAGRMARARARRLSTTAIPAPGTVDRRLRPPRLSPCANDAEVLDGLVGALDSHEFIFGRLMGLADALGWITPKAENVENRNPTGAAETKTENAETPSSSLPDGNSVLAAVTNLNAHLTALHAALPPRTALLLFSGHSDPRSMSTLAARRAEYQGGQNQRHGKPERLWGGCHGNGGWCGALEHGGRSGARGGGRAGADGAVVRWGKNVGGY
ncbi:ribonuclease H-like protein [Lactarius hengduanensis]|nr:ribonuclease H-like protein [Lactarius hengduanensis]